MDDQLRIEERGRALALERQLARHHRQLAALGDEIMLYHTEEAHAALDAALWQLGVVIVQVARELQAVRPG